jgi:hypothetical protein
MPNLLLLFNHTLTAGQEEDARKNLGVAEIILPSPPIRELWCQLAPDAARLVPLLEPVKDWLASQAAVGDYVLIQGDFGACFIMVKYSLKKGLVPLYSTTSRDAVEKHLADGTVELVHAFRHVCFRRYGQ